MRSAIRAVIVVVPVHDEAELLDRCLSSLTRAVAEASVRCVVKIVLDACADGSASIAARHPFPTLHEDANAVGAARASGITAALAEIPRMPRQSVWIANTDADSVVPRNWLHAHLHLADRGADVVVGTVRPDFDDLGPEHQDWWLETHPRGIPNGHTHGANLGIRASTYLEVAGFGILAEHEDVRLVDACRAAGAVIVASDAAEVLTSGRFIGRTPGGYAGYLREQSRRLDRSMLSAKEEFA